MAIAGNYAEKGSFLTEDRLEYSDFSHISITLNGLSPEEKTIENLLGVLINLTVSLNWLGGGGGGGAGVNAVTYKFYTMHSSTP